MFIALTDALRASYQSLFATCVIRPERLEETERLAAAIQQNRPRYEAVGTPLGIPWFFIGAVHAMEASLRFTVHLHNGDPLAARTVNVPANRPAAGSPPFTWEESATDALIFQELDKVTDWSLAGVLYQLEKYNGFGYRTLHPEVLSPYLWSGSNQYTSGKYVADGKFDPDAVSAQCGAAVILRRMAELSVVAFPVPPAATAQPDATIATAADITRLAATVPYSVTARSDRAASLQAALNTIPGILLRPDGVAGPRTSDAVKLVTGAFLVGDPRAAAQTS